MNFRIMSMAGIVLAIINTYWAIKKILIDNILSERGVKNIVLILCIAASLYCSIIIILYSNSCISQLNIYNEGINSRTLTSKELMEISNTIKSLKRYNLKAIIIGYLGLLSSHLLLNNIKKEIIKNLNSHKERWQWHKIEN